ncbi:NADH-quinone oxidoreductase subunit NuoG [Polymorphobacter sp. PAMC 29334]|uniref:NADH-quinone oxidoreductase subunit NuoG n=1 Tax=Polymorphobacter sp. PAMC 29334 TaxID=2862331 RepID=UPI001C79985A|nr:NADH-quinone oxidoreductase subunit NuoG [Polymorphobacter sp. PAMC 29334]QYE34018.1 NADH-quinone oxidoreductase subunit NuoG [Polymorphobacter sp. PAMC 29334]
MPILTVDGIEVEVPAGATVMQACEAAGAEIPRFCYHERLSIAGNCRMCLVDVSPGPPKPQASCALPAADKMVVSTRSAKTQKAREGVMEFLLINHPLDCPICDQGGECDLQDQSLNYGKGHTRYLENKRAVTEKYMGPLVKTVMTRCIHCTRCVRFAEEIAGVEEIGAIGRGENMQITSYLEGAVRSELSGNIIDLCPVGALTSKPYAFEARPWELKRTESIDVMDAVGTNITVHTRGAAVMRVTPRINDDVNEEWASDVTRFAVDGLQRGRLDTPYVRVGGKLQKASWAQAFDAIKTALAGVAGDEIAAVAGDLCDVEAMVALKDLLGTLGSSRHECRVDGAAIPSADRAHYLFNTGLAQIERADVIILVGTNPRWEAPLVNTRIRKAVRRGGAKVFNIGPEVDLTYPRMQIGDDAGVLGDLPQVVVDALASAERPAIIVGTGGMSSLGAVHALVATHNLVRDGWNGVNILHTAASRVGALDIGFVTDGGMAVLTTAAPKILFNLGVDEVEVAGGFTVYIGHHGDRGVRTADVILPAAAYTEKSGTWVNLEGRVQRGARAAFPPGEAREDWTILRALSAVLGQALPYDDLHALRTRIAAEWPHLASEGATPAVWSAPTASTAAAPSGPFTLPVKNFYLTNAIARASATMAECVDQIVNADEPQLEAAE